MRALLLVCSLMLCEILSAQMFVEKALDQDMIVLNTGLWGGGVSMYDFNSDGWPDLSFASNNSGILRFINVEGTFEEYDNLIPQNFVEPEMALYADYDNDGDADLFVTTTNGGSYLFNNQNETWIDVTEEVGINSDNNAWNQGACWGDYDRDGHLDLYVCNYNWNDSQGNWLYHNNGDGTFTEVAELLGVDNGSKQTFQSVFMDYNNDMWPDIFLINDRTPENVMYRNNGDGSFTDVSAAIGVNQSIDAMTATVGDFDKDGDQDIYVTNGEEGNLLLENFAGVFTEVAEGTSLEINEMCWGASWIDGNNSGYEDLYVCGTWIYSDFENQFFQNGPLGLELNTGEFEANNFHAHSSAKGDFNRDGFQDLAVHAIYPDYARLFENNGNGGRSIQIQLQGTVSNRDGVGSTVLTYVNGVPSYLYTMCGGGYMSQDSQFLTIGLGNQQMMDSVRVNWPSGHSDVYYNLNFGELHLLTEGETLESLVQYNQLSYCEGDSIYLSTLNEEIGNWSSGETASGIWTSTPGEYNYIVENESGVFSYSDTVVVSPPNGFISQLTGESPTCFNAENGSISSFINPPPSSIEWSNGASSQNQQNLSSGNFTLTIYNELGCAYSDSVVLSNPEPILVEIETVDPLCFGDATGAAEINATGGTGELTIDALDLDLSALSAGNYPVVVSDENACSIETSISIVEPAPIGISPAIQAQTENELGAVELYASGGTPPYQYYWSNGALDSGISELTAGLYYVTIEDAHSCSFNGQIEIEAIVGVDDHQSREVQIYPNPANSFVEVDLNATESEVQIRSCDGSLLYSAKASQKSTIPTDHLASGIYIISVQQGIKVSFFKLFLQH